MNIAPDQIHDRSKVKALAGGKPIKLSAAMAITKPTAKVIAVAATGPPSCCPSAEFNAANTGMPNPAANIIAAIGTKALEDGALIARPRLG